MLKERIALTDSTIQVVTKMSDGNQGAAITLMQMLKTGSTIDPDGFAGGLGFILLLDTYGIYGSDIYVLNNDICDSNMNKTCAVLRAWVVVQFRFDWFSMLERKSIEIWIKLLFCPKPIHLWLPVLKIMPKPFLKTLL